MFFTVLRAAECTFIAVKIRRFREYRILQEVVISLFLIPFPDQEARYSVICYNTYRYPSVVIPIWQELYRFWIAYHRDHEVKPFSQCEPFCMSPSLSRNLFRLEGQELQGKIFFNWFKKEILQHFKIKKCRRRKDSIYAAATTGFTPNKLCRTNWFFFAFSRGGR